MRMAWLVFFLMTALMASLAALLLDQTASTTTHMLQSSDTLKTQLRQQEEKLSTAQQKLQQISQQLTQMEEAASKPEVISEQIQSQSSLEIFLSSTSISMMQIPLERETRYQTCILVSQKVMITLG